MGGRLIKRMCSDVAHAFDSDSESDEDGDKKKSSSMFNEVVTGRGEEERKVVTPRTESKIRQEIRCDGNMPDSYI
jgi:hypothetical protein